MTGKILHRFSPKVHSARRKRTAVSGKLKEQNSKSEMHNDKTKAVVGWCRIFGDRNKAMMVIKLPNTPTTVKKQAQHPANVVADWGYNMFRCGSIFLY